MSRQGLWGRRCTAVLAALVLAPSLLVSALAGHAHAANVGDLDPMVRRRRRGGELWAARWLRWP